MATDREITQAMLCQSFGPYGKLDFPYVQMGKIDSLNLFDPNELILFAFYWHNRNRYGNVLDIGANLGLHSICMERLGWNVRGFEPDFHIYEKYLENSLRYENCNSGGHISACNAAVARNDGHAVFVRVLDNLTGSHLHGAKDSYGPREEIIVPTVNCIDLFHWADFAKIDCEGAEAELLLTVVPAMMEHLEIMCEVRDLSNALKIYHHFNAMNMRLWSQKNGWRVVDNIDQMPHSAKEGSLFIGMESPF